MQRIGRPTVSLLTYRAGETFRIRADRGVICQPDRITLVLVSDLDRGTSRGYTTTVTVQWPHPFSTAFTERPLVQALIDTVLQLQ